jgi:hypothetical protein
MHPSIHLLRRNKALVLVVRLVPVAVLLLGLQLGRQLLQNRRKQLLPASLVLSVPVPHGNLHRVPAYRVREPTNVVVECCIMLVMHKAKHCHSTYNRALSRLRPAAHRLPQAGRSRARTVQRYPC